MDFMGKQWFPNIVRHMVSGSVHCESRFELYADAKLHAGANAQPVI